MGFEAMISFHEKNMSNPTLKLHLREKKKTAPNSKGIKLYESHPPTEIGLSEVPTEWKEGKLLGSGSFGSVYLGLNVRNGQMIAVKKIQVSSSSIINDTKKAETLQQEISLLSAMKHDNIVSYLGCHLDFEENILNIFLEYVPGGSIYRMLKKFGNPGLCETLIKLYTSQILQGLKYLHDNGIVHRDIKCANILVDSFGRIKLTDFGTSKKIEVYELGNDNQEDTHCKTFTGTPYWMAPEVITGKQYKTECDIWSVGCTLIEMSTGIPPWSELKPFQVLYKIGNEEEPLNLDINRLSEFGQHFVSICIVRDQYARPTADDLLKHPFINQEEDVSDMLDNFQELLNNSIKERKMELEKVTPVLKSRKKKNDHKRRKNSSKSSRRSKSKKSGRYSMDINPINKTESPTSVRRKSDADTSDIIKILSPSAKKSRKK
eukprot:TRINITY_DN7666_c0_g1_i1.p1 TRINITY_DN7666_c0_g1~~TRINITY_DN7666_c0_g1_i1.p1  ORF type:complete len:433 (-),score=95.80 TRINITY_DN7666_c0_g1_i1:29-1327(-)